MFIHKISIFPLVVFFILNSGQKLNAQRNDTKTVITPVKFNNSIPRELSCGQNGNEIIFFKFNESMIDNKKLTWENFNHTSSICTYNSTMATMNLIFNNFQLNFVFNNESDGYSFNNFQYKNGTEWSGKPNLNYDYKFKINEQGYQCNRLVFNIENNATNSIEVQFDNLSFYAFITKSNSTDNLFYQQCTGINRNSSIPIIVGCVLLLIMGICLAVYIFMRRRST